MNTQTWIRVRDWSLLSVLLILALSVMLSVNTPLMRGIRTFALESTANVEQLFAGGARYLRALDENQTLRQENMDLASQVARMREAQLENKRLRNLLGLKKNTTSALKATQIVSQDITRQQNQAIIDLGSTDGIKRGMPVINASGVLGLVTMTSEHYSVVQTYLHTDFRISAMVQPLQTTGIVRWDGQNPNRLLLQHIVKTEAVEPGQTVVTSGYSNIYPRGLKIGTIDSVHTLPGRNELLIHVVPSAAIHRTHYGFVLMRKTDQEYQKLNQQVSS